MNTKTLDQQEFDDILDDLEKDEEISKYEAEAKAEAEKQQLGTISDGHTIEAVQHWLQQSQGPQDRQALERLKAILEIADEDHMELRQDALSKKKQEVIKQFASGEEDPALKERNREFKILSKNISETAASLDEKLRKADQVLKAIVFANRSKRTEDHYKKVHEALSALAKEMMPHAAVIESESLQELIDLFIPSAEDEKIMSVMQTKLKDAENVRKSKKLIKEGGAYELATQMVLDMLTRPAAQKNQEFYSALEKKAKTELDQMALGAAKEDVAGAERATRETAKYEAKVGRELSGEVAPDEEANVDWMNDL